MDYKQKQETDDAPHHHVSAKRRKKKLTREDFKQDVADAVKKGMTKKTKKKPKKMYKGDIEKPKQIYKAKGGYAGMSVAELRRLLNQKKKSLLTKSGFPEGKLPRSKLAMIALCKKLKRKRW